jgi:hypothetical protein
MAGIIYTLCALAALTCAYLLLQAYRTSRYRLLLWSGICFVGLSLNNLMLVADKLLVRGVDLSLWRSGFALVAMAILLYGVIWDAD